MLPRSVWCCILLVTLSFTTVKSLCLNNCSIIVNSSDETSSAGCTNNSCSFVCNDLVFALTNVDTLCGQSVRMYLAGEKFNMEYYGINISKDINIEGQNAAIYCGDISDDDETTSVWYFYNYVNVELRGIHFNDCKRPLRFHSGSNLIISDCVFSNFSHGTLDVLDSLNFSMQNSVLRNGTTPAGNGSIRADSGGLALQYDRTSTTFYASLENCYFIGSTAGERVDFDAILRDFLAEEINSGINQNQFTGRGGGVGVYIRSNNDSFVTIEVNNCSFMHNYAELFGGGLYLYVGGSDSNHSVVVRDTLFLNNSCAAAGGAVQMALLIENVGYPGSQFNYTNCVFRNNNADFGGALSAIQTFVGGRGNVGNVDGCTFEENTAIDRGSAITFASLLYPENPKLPHSYRIINSNFTNNVDSGGIVNLGFNNADFYGVNKFEGNSGPSLRIVGSLIQVFGDLVFRNNSVRTTTGAAVHITEFGQLQIADNSSIEFTNNTGESSACILVELETSPVPLASRLECFIIHADDQGSWNNVNISFSGNKARLGVAMFSTSLKMCSRLNFSSNADSQAESPSLLHFGVNSNTNLAMGTDPSDRQYYVQTLANELRLYNKSVSARPGQIIKLAIEPIDEFGHITFATMRFSDIKDNANPQSFNPSAAESNVHRSPNAIDLIRTDPILVPYFPSNGYVTISFGLPNFPTEFVEPSVIQDTKILIEMPYNTKNIDIQRFNLTILPCQAGFALRKQSSGLVECDCVYNDLFFYHTQVISCKKDTQEIILADGYWSLSVKRDRYHLVNYPCPVPHCMCLDTDEFGCRNYYNHSIPNAQCHPSREGILCGSCVNNTGVGVISFTCLDNCRVDIGVIAIIILVIWNGLLAILFLWLSQRFPPNFKGILFYIQVVPYATGYFPITVFRYKLYMSYISNFLSFYYPVDFCLFSGVDAIAVYATGYIPLLVIVVTQAITVAIMRSFNFTRRFLRKSSVWNGIWTWILLVYSRYVYNSLTILHCPKVGNEGVRWFVDGTVKCYQTPAHALLSLLAIFILVFSLGLIPVTLLIVFKRLKTRHAVLYMYDPLTQGYKVSTKWWASIDLFRRYLFIFSVVILPGRTLAPTGILFIAFLMHIYYQPYENKWHNWLETYVLLHFIVMMLLRSTTALLESLTNYDVTMVPVSNQQLNDTKAWPQSDKASIFFLVWIYFPVLLAVLLAVVYCITTYLIAIFQKIKSAAVKKWKSHHTSDGDNDVDLLRYHEMEKSTESIVTVTYA